MSAPGARPRLILGTRGSDLALAQARLVENALRSARPDFDIETKIIRTSGDERAAGAAALIDLRAGRKGMFTREIERSLLGHEVDIAVHSAKDLPSEMTAGLVITAVLPRASAGDVLISKNGTFAGRGRIGTSSVRRQQQVRRKWPNAEPVELRGNVPTRLRKLAEAPELSAIVLARAGLERLALTFDWQIEDLALSEFVPAGGQGIIAIETRRDDLETAKMISMINHEPTLRCLRAEREFLRLLAADCNSPVGVLARIDSGLMKMNAQLFPPYVPDFCEAEISAAADDAPEDVAARLMEKLNVH